ncbi:GntR family transcriptional regulator [Eubacteriales bacterium OttesenSCG-928-K08]|nr:GntR family transcriptional regulator [Eubacteriales bacterium OttesenSCG-928-K08]
MPHEVTRISIKEQVYQILRERILRQEFRQGDRMNIDAIARDLQVSNSPVREAISLLEMEGLVVSRPNASTVVIDLNRDDYFELAQLTFFWVVSAYRFCVRSGKSQKLSDMLLEQLEEQKQFLEKNDKFLSTEAAVRFTRCILVATENARLLKQFDNIFGLLVLLYHYAREQEDPTGKLCFAQQQSIYEAVRERWHDDTVEGLAKHFYRPVWGDDTGR